MESRTRRNPHVRFGGRARETDQPKGWHRASVRSNRTWATLALVAGVDVKTVSERLGHSRPLVTWQTYQHFIKGMQTDAPEKAAALIFGTSSA